VFLTLSYPTFLGLNKVEDLRIVRLKKASSHEKKELEFLKICRYV